MSDRTLSEQQQRAIDALIAGSNQQQTAALVGVERHTIKRWQTEDALFIAEMNSRQYAAQSENVDRLRRLGSSALDVLENGLDSDDEKTAIQCALQILKMLNLASIALVNQSDLSVGVVSSKLETQRVSNMMAMIQNRAQAEKAGK